MGNFSALILYFSVVLLSALLFYIAIKHKKSRSVFWPFIILAIAIPCAFLCLKYTSLQNADYGRYIIVSKEISKMDFIEYINFESLYKLETSFWVMSKVSWALSSGPFLMFSIYYISTMIFFVSGIFSTKELSPFRSTIVYIFFLTTIVPLGASGVRSLLAVSIIYFALVNLLNDKNKNFFLLAVLAAIIHNLSIVASVIIYVTFKFYQKKQTSWRKTLTMLIIPTIVLFFVFASLTYGNILNFIIWVPVLNKYQSYQTVLQLNESLISSSSIVAYNVWRSAAMAALLSYSICVYFITTKSEERSISINSSKLLILATLGITLGSISFVSRVSAYLAPLLIIAIYSLTPENKRTSIYLTPVILSYVVGVFVVFVFIADYTGFFPLHFIWESLG